MGTPEGERFICSLMEMLGAFEPSWHPKNALLAKAATLRDFGQEILDDIALASEEAHSKLQYKMRIRRKMTGTMQWNEEKEHAY